MKAHIEQSIENLICEAAHNAQCEFYSFEQSHNYILRSTNEWVYDVERIEMRARRLLDICIGRCSLGTTINTDLIGEVLKLREMSETYCRKMAQLENLASAAPQYEHMYNTDNACAQTCEGRKVYVD